MRRIKYYWCKLRMWIDLGVIYICAKVFKDEEAIRMYPIMSYKTRHM